MHEARIQRQEVTEDADKERRRAVLRMLLDNSYDQHKAAADIINRPWDMLEKLFEARGMAPEAGKK